MRRIVMSLLAALLIASCNINSNAAHTIQNEVTSTTTATAAGTL